MNAPHSLVKQYQKVASVTQDRDGDVSPHKQIELLMDGAIHRLRLAEAYVHQGDRAGKAKAAADAGAIIDALSACLDLQRGGEMAQRLADLYDYAARRLSMANLRDDAAGFAEAASLIEEVAGAWKQIRPA